LLHPPRVWGGAGCASAVDDGCGQVMTRPLLGVAPLLCTAWLCACVHAPPPPPHQPPPPISRVLAFPTHACVNGGKLPALFVFIPSCHGGGGGRETPQCTTRSTTRCEARGAWAGWPLGVRSGWFTHTHIFMSLTRTHADWHTRRLADAPASKFPTPSNGASRTPPRASAVAPGGGGFRVHIVCCVQQTSQGLRVG
jgi:hypothetical protein